MRLAKFILAALAAAVLTASAQEAAPRTRVDFTASPEGARVLVDGTERGVTPFALLDLAPGLHRVKYRMEGRLDRDLFVDVVSGSPCRCHAALEPERGLLLVRGRPEGCDIVVDGVSVGRSPRLVTTLDAARPHRVTLRKTGYLTGEFDVRFEGRRPYVLDEALVLDSGVVEIVTDPAGAEVTVNGIARGVTPVVVDNLPKGITTVKVSREGFREEVRELAVKAGERQTLSLALAGLPGTLSLSSVPDGARFYVDGEFRGKGQVTIPALRPGEYRVRAELEGYGAEERTVVIANGASPREEFRLSNVMGRLEIRTSPVGAQVVVDGRVVGTTKAKAADAEVSDIFPVENLMDGEHVVLLRLDGYDDVTRRPVVERMKTSQLKVKMKRIFVPNVEILTNTGKVTGILVGQDADSVTVEVKLGITRGIRRTDIRKLTFIR